MVHTWLKPGRLLGQQSFSQGWSFPTLLKEYRFSLAQDLALCFSVQDSFSHLPTARLEPTTRDGLMDMVYQNRVSKNQRSRVPEPMAVPATCHRGLGHRLSQALMCCWRRRCSILPLHIWGSLLRKAQRLQFPTWLGTDSRGGLPQG